MGQGIPSTRPQPRPQPQPADFSTARALIADGNITREDAAAIGEGVRQNKISGDQLTRLQGEASRYVLANRNTRGAMPFGSGTLLADNRQVDMGVADLQGLRSATPAPSQPSPTSGPQRSAAPAGPDLAERGRQMIDREVASRLNALPFKTLRDAIPQDHKTADGAVRRDSPFYDALQYSGSDQFRRLAQAFESAGNPQVASFSAQEATRLERAETMRRDAELRQAGGMPRPGEASAPQSPAQPREVRASEMRGRNDLSADEPRTGFNQFQVRVSDSEGRSTTVSIVNTGSLSSEQLRSQAIELARAGKSSNLQ